MTFLDKLRKLTSLHRYVLFYPESSGEAMVNRKYRAAKLPGHIFIGHSMPSLSRALSGLSSVFPRTYLWSHHVISSLVALVNSQGSWSRSMTQTVLMIFSWESSFSSPHLIVVILFFFLCIYGSVCYPIFKTRQYIMYVCICQRAFHACGFWTSQVFQEETS